MKNIALICLFSLAPLLGLAQTYSGQRYQTPPPRYAPPPQYQPRAYAPEPVIYPYDERGRPNPDAFDWTGFSLGASVGTLGLGTDATVFLAEWVNFRASANVLAFTYKDTVDNIDYDYDTDFMGVRLLLDFHPTDAGNFRISAGVALNNNSVDIKGIPRPTVRIGDATFSAGQFGTVTGTADFDSLAPYVGIGFGNSVKPDTAWSFLFELGVMFQSYDLDLKASGSQANSEAVNAALKIVEKDIEDVLDYAKIYPVIMFGVAYHF